MGLWLRASDARRPDRMSSARARGRMYKQAKRIREQLELDPPFFGCRNVISCLTSKDIVAPERFTCAVRNCERGSRREREEEMKTAFNRK